MILDMTKYDDTGDFFSVYMENGVKIIKFWGYLYTSGEAAVTTEESDEPLIWRKLEYTGMEFPLSEYFKERYEAEASRCNQNIEDLSEKDAAYIANNWFKVVSIPSQDGEVKSVDVITPDLECGLYRLDPIK